MSYESISSLPIAPAVNPLTDYAVGVVYTTTGGIPSFTTYRVSLSLLVGPAGQNGTNGTNGSNGLPAQFSAVNATTLPPGSQATATLGGSGPSNYTITFGLPQGAAGTGNVSSSGTPTAGSIPVFVSYTGGIATVANATATQIRTAAAAASSGPNSDITSLASPALSSATATTQTAGDSSTKVATTAFVASSFLTIASASATYAPIASPAFTGTPTVPTATAGTSTTQAASTAFVAASFLTQATAASTYAPLSSPALTGTPTAPTATAGTNTTQIATTAFVLANGGSGGGSGAPSAVITTTSGTNVTAAVADKGKTYLLSGSATLSLPAAVQTSGWYAWVKKTDGNGVWAITPASVTIDGLVSINCYQESYLIWWDSANSVFRTQNRPKGWINIGSTTVSAAVASVAFTTGFADTELRDMQFDGNGISFSASSYGVLTLRKSGAYQTASYSAPYSYYYSSGSTSGASTTGFLTSVGPVASGYVFDATVLTIQSTTLQKITFNDYANGSAGTAQGVQTTAAAITGVAFAANSGNVTGGTFNQKAFRP